MNIFWEKIVVYYRQTDWILSVWIYASKVDHLPHIRYGKILANLLQAKLGPPALLISAVRKLWVSSTWTVFILNELWSKATLDLGLLDIKAVKPNLSASSAVEWPCCFILCLLFHEDKARDLVSLYDLNTLWNIF